MARAKYYRRVFFCPLPGSANDNTPRHVQPIFQSYMCTSRFMLPLRIIILQNLPRPPPSLSLSLKKKAVFKDSIFERSEREEQKINGDPDKPN